jgi:hypothetical protein
MKRTLVGWAEIQQRVMRARESRDNVLIIATAPVSYRFIEEIYEDRFGGTLAVLGFESYFAFDFTGAPADFRCEDFCEEALPFEAALALATSA